MKYMYIGCSDCLGATIAQWEHAGLQVSKSSNPAPGA